MKQNRGAGAEIKEKRHTLIWKTPSQLQMNQRKIV